MKSLNLFARLRAWIPGIAFVLATTFTLGCASKRAPKFKPADAAREIFEADRAFARMSADRGPAAAFAQFTTAVSVQLPASGPPVVGNQAIADFMAGPPNTTLTWRPERSEASIAGDVGWSWGDYEARTPTPNGNVSITTGRYLSVWRRHANGAWRVVLDIGNVAR